MAVSSIAASWVGILRFFEVSGSFRPAPRRTVKVAINPP